MIMITTMAMVLTPTLTKSLNDSGFNVSQSIIAGHIQVVVLGRCQFPQLIAKTDILSNPDDNQTDVCALGQCRLSQCVVPILETVVDDQDTILDRVRPSAVQW